MSSQQKAALSGQLSLRSPAKVNVFFRVLSKREDGFHDIASIYQAIDLCDTLHVSLADRDAFTCTDPSLPLDERNLVHRALQLFRKKTGIMIPFSLHLEKNIPIEAGLGGGSSNAATALFAFAKLASFPILKEHSVLRSWAAELGSDVPFFFTSGTAYATGRGEVLEDLPPALISPFCIVKPSFGLSTSKVYGACSRQLYEGRDPLIDKEAFLKQAPLFYNDLEAPAFFLSPDLAEIKKKLVKSGFSTVCMTGSGTAFICLGESFNAEFLKDMWVATVKTLQRKEDSWYE